MNAEARQSFRYRLREAARLSLEMGDALLALSQDAAEPTPELLAVLRDLERSLDNSLYWIESLKAKTVKPPVTA